MANFLDQKEEVLKIELTKYGRKLLSQGILQPEYYQFFDDSVVYDLGYANLSEIQNNSKERIMNNSPSITSLNVIDDINLRPLGTSSPSNDYAPSWNLNVLNGELLYNSDSSDYCEKVFDVKDIIYTISVEDKNVTNIPNYNVSNFELDNGKIIDIADDYLLIELTENNMEDNSENFSIEISTYDDLAGGIAGGLERKLLFADKQTNIIDGIIYDETELPNRFIDVKLDKNDAQFYLDVLVDNEIDQAIITKAAKNVQEQVKATYSTTFEGVTKEDC